MCLSGVAQVRHDRRQAAGLDGAPRFEQAVFAHESGVRPGAEAHEINASARGRDRAAREFELQVVAQELDDPLPVIAGLLAGQSEQNEIVDVAAVAAGGLQLPGDEMVDRVHVDQRIQLRQQVADRYADIARASSKHHHHIDQPLVFQLALH